MAAVVLLAVSDGGVGERREEAGEEEAPEGAVGGAEDTEGDSEGEDRLDEGAGAPEWSVIALGDDVSG